MGGELLSRVVLEDYWRGVDGLTDVNRHVFLRCAKRGGGTELLMNYFRAGLQVCDSLPLLSAEHLFSSESLEMAERRRDGFFRIMARNPIRLQESSLLGAWAVQLDNERGPIVLMVRRLHREGVADRSYPNLEVT